MTAASYRLTRRVSRLRSRGPPGRPAEATVDDVRAIYLAAWKAKVKGITVYRYGSRHGQVFSYLGAEQPLPAADVAFSGGCIGRDCGF
ncbi:hypothetical protein MSAS_00410 [Mycobacterium saskatchewanense]|uniref:Uncharacterized protein n=1 Tax=Mycobacterium saskatchewanense TaxID=220927 RepID=A0AAJ3NML4_9MYCO|nr:hypothetical protein AWC23_21450 [Mycobacterium saskatchewanense]BBX60867.1 hypothetical protein MSAS_00410 [Mycobacterium saskatchewanense]